MEKETALGCKACRCQPGATRGTAVPSRCPWRAPCRQQPLRALFVPVQPAGIKELERDASQPARPWHRAWGAAPAPCHCRARHGRQGTALPAPQRRGGDVPLPVGDIWQQPCDSKQVVVVLGELAQRQAERGQLRGQSGVAPSIGVAPSTGVAPSISVARFGPYLLLPGHDALQQAVQEVPQVGQRLAAQRVVEAEEAEQCHQLPAGTVGVAAWAGDHTHRQQLWGAGVSPGALCCPQRGRDGMVPPPPPPPTVGHLLC